MRIGNDFITHLKYATCLAKLSAGLTLTHPVSTNPENPDLGLLNGKLNLINLTKRSLENERKIVEIDKEYSLAAVLWLPTKTYYLLYHQLCVLDYILTANVDSLRFGHEKCRNIFTNRIKRGDLRFSQPLFNSVFDKNHRSFKESRPGEHLSNNAPDELIFKLSMKKIGEYKLEEFKRKREIKNLRKSGDKAKFNHYLTFKFQVSVFDFFYFMRVKSTYREFDFISGISSEQTKLYFEQYLKASENICKSVRDLMRTLCPTLPTDG